MVTSWPLVTSSDRKVRQTTNNSEYLLQIIQLFKSNHMKWVSLVGMSNKSGQLSGSAEHNLEILTLEALNTTIIVFNLVVLRLNYCYCEQNVCLVIKLCKCLVAN